MKHVSARNVLFIGFIIGIIVSSILLFHKIRKPPSEERIVVSAPRKIHFSHPDRLGSLNLTTDQNRSVVASISYTPFGEILTTPHPTLNTLHFKYTGQEWDEPELYNYGARSYDPALARFMSVDALRQHSNPYAYSVNNPIRYLDPRMAIALRISPI